MFKSEWLKIFKTKKMLIPIIAVLFIPVMYSGMFLWAFWDPYSHLDNLPVAIVNEDKGATFEGETLTVGDDLTKNLIDSEQFHFEEVASDLAEEKLKDGDYYIVIRIPENFSQHATTLLDENPSKLVIDYIPNEGSNFLGSQIGSTAIEKIKAEVNKQVSKTYAESLFSSITKLGDGFAEAADGAGKLDAGAQKLANGATDLQSYLEQLAASTIELSDGSNELTTGAEKAATGATTLAQGITAIEDGSKQLAAGANDAAAGADSLVNGIKNYTNGVAQIAAGQATLVEKQQNFASGMQSLLNNSSNLHAGAQQLNDNAANLHDGINALSKQMQEILTSLPKEQAQALQATLTQLNEGSAQLAGGLSQFTSSTGELQQGVSQLNDGSTQLVAGQQQIAKGINEVAANTDALVNGANSLAEGNTTIANKLTELASGASAAKDGANQLATGLNDLVSGNEKLAEGTTLLAEKSGELAEGSSSLADGTKELVDGTANLSSNLLEASEQANVKANDENYDMAAQPVDVEKKSVNHVPNYGTGFAPYFISLGLFVGALMISIVFPFVEPAIRPTNPAAWFMSKISVLAVVGIIQALISVVVVVGILGLEVESIAWFTLTAIFASFTFLAIVQMLVSLFGDPGRFIAIIVLIIQLTSSAGTFPLELIPSQLQVFNPFFPMTYTVQAFKVAISTGDFSFLGFNYAVLAGFAVVCLAITFGYFTLLFKKRYSKQAEA
ncbi:YhgE/Pip domain-containing protein [Solibacillus sp. CAU 1738]|uniref:YhgE/Pip domain-containing protein n=1 Tax=Solibacillus sp. CAU 1738 TaxID=3140363 RepID=UPI003260F9F9